MATLQQQIEFLIASDLSKGHAELETLPSGHVVGHIISTDFRRKTYAERRERINQCLARHLTHEQMSNISSLLTYTPEEWNVEVDTA